MRILFVQEQLAQAHSPLVDFYYLSAQTRVVDMHDLELAIEKLSREKLASVLQNLPDWKLAITHNQDAVITRIHDQARKSSIPGIQCSSLANWNAHFSTQVFSSHSESSLLTIASIAASASLVISPAKNQMLIEPILYAHHPTLHFQHRATSTSRN